jgi:two-component system nitrate/nitrite response regulator NarL
MTIRILLIDDHTLFRSGVRALLQRTPDFEVVGEAADGHEGIKRAKQFCPDVILLDVNMPGLSGLETLRLLVQDVPQAAVVMLTVSEDVEELSVALRDGACGFLLKNIEADTLAAAIRKAAAGQPVIADDMTAKLVASMRRPAVQADVAPVASAPIAASNPLTSRERDIIRELSRGASNKEIARTLSLAESTVKIHVRNILRKLNFTSRVQVALYAAGRDAASVLTESI